MGDVIYSDKFQSKPAPIEDTSAFDDWLPWQKSIAAVLGYDPRLFITEDGGVQMKVDGETE